MTGFGARIVAAFRTAVANKTVRVATALALAVTVAVSYGIWLDWEWKAMIGWKALEGYINPDPGDTTGKKDAVQVYAVIVAGVVAAITAADGLANLRLTRKNLEQQRKLEAQRAQGTALQAYYEQIGKLLTEYDLRTTDREEIRELARGQTLTVLQEVDGNGKRRLLAFLHGAGLLGADKPAVELTDAYLEDADLHDTYLQGAKLQGANLQRAKLQDAKLQRAKLQDAKLQGADLHDAHLKDASLEGANLQGTRLQGAYLKDAKLQGANNLKDANLQGAYLHDAYLQGAKLQGTKLQGADLEGADLKDAIVNAKQLVAEAASLKGATMPDGSTHP